jgi:hypothetical protein
MMMYGFGNNNDPIIIDNYKVVAVLHASDGSGNLVAKTNYVKVYSLGTNIQEHLCVAQLIGSFLKCILPKTNMLLLLLI